jgi:zinc and cadmium transporter
MQVWFFTLLSVIIVSAISLIGVVTLSVDRARLQSMLLFLVSFAVGALFGDAFIHLLPNAFETLGSGLHTSLLIIAGLLLFFVLEKILRWRHCHTPTSEVHLHPVVTLNLVGDAAHNFIDGMLIAASFIASVPVGISTTLAVILHEIPQEIGDFGVLVHGGLPIRKALLFNFATALTSILGAGLVLIVGAHIQGLARSLIPLTAGGFIYIAGSDLVPELMHGCEIKKSTAIYQFLCIVLGISLMALLAIIE